MLDGSMVKEGVIGVLKKCEFFLVPPTGEWKGLSNLWLPSLRGLVLVWVMVPEFDFGTIDGVWSRC